MDGKPAYTGAIDEQGKIVGKMPQYIYSTKTNEFEEVEDISWAFCGNTYITSIPEIPSTVTSLECQAFKGCTGLTSITIPAHIKNIDNDVFDGCSGLTSINVENGNTVYDSRDNCNAVIETSTNKLAIACKTTVIPTSVTSIGSSAFGSAGKELTSINIPTSITSIESWAFSGCTGLTSINIPTSVTSIGSSAFRDCTGLTSINIPTSVTSIGSCAFDSCTGLTSINIPTSVTSMGEDVFAYWKSSQTINCQAPGKPSGWDYGWNSYCDATITWKVNM